MRSNWPKKSQTVEGTAWAKNAKGLKARTAMKPSERLLAAQLSATNGLSDPSVCMVTPLYLFRSRHFAAVRLNRQNRATLDGLDHPKINRGGLVTCL